MALEALSQSGDALEVMRAGMRVNPSNEKLYSAFHRLSNKSTKDLVFEEVIRAREKFESGEYDSAASLLSWSIERNPQNWSYYLYRALTYVAMSRGANAARDVKRLIHIQPSWIKVRAPSCRFTSSSPNH